MTVFGQKKRNGSAKKHHDKAAKGVIRAALQALETAGILMRYNDKRNRYTLLIVYIYIYI